MGNQREISAQTENIDRLIAQVQQPDAVMSEVNRLRDQDNFHEMPAALLETRSAAQAGYELARNDWTLLVDADGVTRGKLSNYGLDKWDLEELAANGAYPFDCEQRETLQYLSNHIAEISPQGRLTAANLIDFARQKASQFDPGIKAPESFDLSSKTEQAKSIAADLDAGKNRLADEKFRHASEFLHPDEFKKFVLEIKRQEKEGVGSDVILYDSSGNPTTDEKAAAGFLVDTQRNRINQDSSTKSIDLSPDDLAKDLDSGNSVVAAEKLAAASKTMSQKQFGEFVKQVHRKEQVGVGAAVILLDAQGKETEDEANAVGFDIRLPVSTNNSQ